MGFYISNGYEEDCKSMAEDLGTPPPFRRDDAYEYMLRNPLPQQPHPQHTQINTNTYISVALFILIVSGVVWITNTINRFDSKIDTLSGQIVAVQNVHESWSYQDMFKWCVRLQRDNPQIKIPDPESAK